MTWPNPGTPPYEILDVSDLDPGTGRMLAKSSCTKTAVAARKGGAQAHRVVSQARLAEFRRPPCGNPHTFSLDRQTAQAVLSSLRRFSQGGLAGHQPFYQKLGPAGPKSGPCGAARAQRDNEIDAGAVEGSMILTPGCAAAPARRASHKMYKSPGER